MRTEQVLERLKPCHFIWSNSNHILQAQYQASCWLSWLWTVKTMVLSFDNFRCNKKPCLEPISNKFSLHERSLNVQININSFYQRTDQANNYLAFYICTLRDCDSNFLYEWYFYPWHKNLLHLRVWSCFELILQWIHIT